ncbi:uncharacterized protein TRIADDRAFT_59356 [Trichoplax adhaerens]|uniref:C-type lectin domain-containing protein n=1 Tax=Trichoplax adhaerens TaxID=10228 RepID=B3S4V1_TRIAD|nr:predicted protein [Trichoplax adhaerens]EDV22275.1 predicted protein [Trichoplax adhaerens]|eukprot:XP_002115430.1 predicted protein [Trichoplax adhaerens]
MNFDNGERFCQGMNNATLLELRRNTDYMMTVDFLLDKNYSPSYWIGMKKATFSGHRSFYSWISTPNSYISPEVLTSLAPNTLSNSTIPSCVALSYSFYHDRWVLAEHNCSDELPFLCQNNGILREIVPYLNAPFKTDNKCQTGWYRPTEDYCVKAFHYALPVVKARQICQYARADLAEISSRRTQNIVDHYLNTKGLSYFWYSFGLYQSRSNHFKWMESQEESHYFHWHANNPRKSINCTVLHRHKTVERNMTWKWRSYGCDSYHSWFICSKNLTNEQVTFKSLQQSFTSELTSLDHQNQVPIICLFDIINTAVEII